jgi:hypothetical protein
VPAQVGPGKHLAWAVLVAGAVYAMDAGAEPSDQAADVL